MGDAADDMLRNRDEYEVLRKELNRKGKMAKDKKKTNKPDRSAPSGGLAVRTFGGLNADNFTAGVGLGDRFKFEKRGKAYGVQFVAEPGEGTAFIEFWQHQFRDGQGWKYVPCLEADCPLCQDEDKEVAKRRYRFVTNVYSIKEKKIVILEGPKDLSSRIFRRWESAHKATKKKGKEAKPFTSRVYGLTQNDTAPITYDVEELTDEKAAKLDPKEFHDLQKYINSAVERFYQGKPVASKKSDKQKGKSALDADETQEDSFTEEQLKGLSEKKLLKAAKSFGIDPEGVAPEKLIKKILKAQK